jgi:hypothetical protein
MRKRRAGQATAKPKAAQGEAAIDQPALSGPGGMLV